MANPFIRLMNYPRRSLRAKLFGFFLIVAIVPLLLLGYLAYEKSSEIVHTQINEYGRSAITQLHSQLDSYSRQMQFTARYIYAYLLDPIHNTLHEEEPSNYASYLDQKNFTRFLEAHKTLETAGLYLITQSDFYYGLPQINLEQLRKQNWWTEVPADYQGAYWTGIHSTDYYISRNLNIPDHVIGLIFPLRSQFGALENSSILIELDATKILESFDLLENDLHSTISIKDETGRIIYASTPAGQETSGKEDDLVWTKQLESNQWTIEVRAPYEHVYRSTVVIPYMTFLIIGIALLLALLFSFLFSSRITRRFTQLKNKMQLVGIGNLHSRIDFDTEDELGRLGASFNKMVEQIKSLLLEVKMKEQLKKEAELRAFHYQINPHLLFNTLNSIQWKAKLKGDSEIQEMIHHLTRVLEGSLNVTEELVTLKKELATIQHYLSIQKIRYGPVFQFHLSFDERLSHYLIPRMTLQPLIENSFFHGFDDGHGAIGLEIFADGEELVLILTDDGNGIEEDKLRTIPSPNPPGTGRGGLGCFNVDQKFKLHFGGIYGMKIESVLNQGVTITIRWPKLLHIPSEQNDR